MQKATVDSAYCFMSATALWPVAEALRQGNETALATLGTLLASSTAASMWANQLKEWKDEADGASKLAKATKDRQTREQLDTVLEKLGAVDLAGESLQGKDRVWFEETLQKELRQIGNLNKFKAHLGGSMTIAQGRGARAHIKRSVVAGKISKSTIHVGDIVNRPGVNQRKAEGARRNYLAHLRRACQVLPLGTVGIDEATEQDVSLDQVYTDLDTTTPVSLTEKEKGVRGRDALSFGRDKEMRHLTALEAAGKCSRLVLLGDPGGGKSTFVKKLISWQATAQLDNEKPIPGISRELLPVFVELLGLYPKLVGVKVEEMALDDARKKLAELLHVYVAEVLARFGASAFEECLREALGQGRCLLVLDGLDEVPPDLRNLVHQATIGAVTIYRPERIIITCRIRSYFGSAILPGFEAHTLAPFDEDKVRKFTSAWYNAQKQLGRVHADQAKKRADDLATVALSGELRELSENPMLLTAMAGIHQRDIGLPKERVRLYKLAVELLLHRWQKRKTGESSMAPSTGLTSFLNDNLRLWGVMEKLAYESHRIGRLGKETAGLLSRGEILTWLEDPRYCGSAGLAAEFLDYVDQRAGILVGKGGEPGRPTGYSFPHRTFQEYLAGCCMLSQRDLSREFFARAGERDHWQFAAELGTEELLYNRRGLNSLMDLAYSLYPNDSTSTQARRALLWAGKMSVLAGRESIERDTDSPSGGRAFLEDRLIPNLVSLLKSDLSAPERADAGAALALLGDPRFDPEAWHLPKEDLLGFVEMPEGPFLMGSDPEHDKEASEDKQEQHPVTLPRYYIARYPVTVAQFRFFVEKTKYKPRDEDSLRGLPNHPVVNVSWHDAIAYCKWLTDELRNSAGTPEPLANPLRNEGWRITLPSEAQWEKAARGGIQLPDGMDNPNPGRIYPWGDEFDPNKANTDEAKIGTTSAVGCFPEGHSPYGILDMSGNVWEWTRSLWGKEWGKSEFPYPYDPEDRRREALDAPNEVARVLRGGSFGFNRWFARCAYRYWYFPYYWLRLIGFRVVASPFLL
ncbi:MAG: SUMF1/EgtB/PvdO family nonheme iron enzyme [Deltaproteobacteria bacterium]|nr:SUMF1/EgtB/PvdO family nonheme iron enzyme [Deltaproteobacteria bacterium]